MLQDHCILIPITNERLKRIAAYLKLTTYREDEEIS